MTIPTAFPSSIRSLLVLLLIALATQACTPDRSRSRRSDDPEPTLDAGRSDSASGDDVPLDDAASPDDAGLEDAAPDAELPPDDAGTPLDDADASPDDADTSPDADLPPDADMPPTSDALLLEGVVLAPDRVLDPGQVLVVGDTIICVAADCSGDPAAVGATVLRTGGIISPGLIDSHNHLAYNFLPEWVPPEGSVYTNRYQWADDPSYEAHVLPYTKHRSSSSHFCPGAKWGEWRSLMHGTTTQQGQSFDRNCTDSWVRNADHSQGLQYDTMRTDIGSVRDITDAEAMGYLESFNAPSNPTTRFAVHMTEGFEGNHIDEEFDSYAGRDTRNNRHMGISLLEEGTTILIHAMDLTDAQLIEARDTGSFIVWSPSSNLTLYGVTANIDRILELGIPTGLGPDWTLSGEDNMLAEMRFSLAYAQTQALERVTPEVIWRMSTLWGADVLGQGAFVGQLTPGYKADLVVFTPAERQDPYEAVLNSRADDVALVLIGGQGFYGDAGLLDTTALHAGCERLSVCGVEKYLCTQDPRQDDRGDETLNDVRTQLINILEGTGFPDDEQYGRGSELLELFNCEE